MTMDLGLRNKAGQPERSERSFAKHLASADWFVTWLRHHIAMLNGCPSARKDSLVEQLSYNKLAPSASASGARSRRWRRSAHSTWTTAGQPAEELSFGGGGGGAGKVAGI